MRFFMKVYAQVGGETGHSEGKNLGSKGPRRIQPRLPTRRALAGLRTGVYIYILHIYTHQEAFCIK